MKKMFLQFKIELIRKQTLNNYLLVPRDEKSSNQPTNQSFNIK